MIRDGPPPAKINSRALADSLMNRQSFLQKISAAPTANSIDGNGLVLGPLGR